MKSALKNRFLPNLKKNRKLIKISNKSSKNGFEVKSKEIGSACITIFLPEICCSIEFPH